MKRGVTNREKCYFDKIIKFYFVTGRRKCLGETVARQTTFLFIACLLQRLHFKLPLNHSKPRLQGTEGFVAMPPKLDIVAVQRY